MTYLEIRDSLQGLTKEERAELMLDLRLLERIDDPEYIRELTRRMDDMRAGKFMTSEEMRRDVANRQQPA